MSELRVEHLEVHYGDLVGVADVSLDVKPASIVALLGSNGAGKTTTLNCIAGLVRPSGGSITWRGNAIGGEPAYAIVAKGLSGMLRGPLATEGPKDVPWTALHPDKAAGEKASQLVVRADETIKVDQAAIETAKVQLSYCYIHSPIDGRAGQRLVDIGNVVNPGGQGNNDSSGVPNNALLVIERLDPIYADFTISQNNLTAVQDQMRAGTLSAEVRLPDTADDPVSGRLTFVDNAVQTQTGQVTLRATLPNPGHRFWPGRFVNVRLLLGTVPGAVLVPASAPQMSANGSYIIVVKPDSTAEHRQVSLGQRQGDLIIVEKGIAAGEKVVTNGQLGVTPGGKVAVEQPREANSPAATAVSGSKS